ncbi:MAG: GNAT family N-acetyltransferase [Gemmatimonadales bacterium]|jgi:GNAT superfamily N-acetyltransferase|nr:GNAT family N-acetyltransferase [Gemmatimonadales bacterium]
MNDVRITPMDQDADFAAWLTELLEREAAEAGLPTGFDDHYIGLTSELGDWIGGLRFYVRGGVAHLLDLAVAGAERGQGHAQRLIAAFEERARDDGAELAEFWTDDGRAEGLLAALGWRVVIRRPNYMHGRAWTLLEKPLHE